MKTKNRNWLFLFLMTGVTLILVYGCSGSDEDNNTTSITDKDGNVYTSVTIGTQVWMVENLKTTKYNDGTDIPLVTEVNTWLSLTTPGYCWFDNDASTYKAPYGAYYNWWAANNGKLCPTGWHVPTDADITTLTTFLGGINNAGGKLKEEGIIHWKTPNEGATNQTGFTALPAGTRDGAGGGFAQMGNVGMWWYINNSDSDPAYYFNIWYDDSKLNSFNAYTDGHKRTGCSVRCLKN
jgi:uncharacterized protein (TIGR02145 family)